MALILKLESHASLPDGGPVSVAVRGECAMEIGRDKFVDWTLPDPTRVVSSRHCQVKFENGDFVLVDFSTNGTFVNDSVARVQSPYRLRDGDRLRIGEYVVSVAIGDDVAPAEPAFDGFARPKLDRNRDQDALWDVDGDIAPPSDPRELRPKGRPAPVYGDFLTHNIDAPRISDSDQFTPAISVFDVPVHDAPAPAAAPRVPEPRRRAPSPDSIWMTEEPAAALSPITESAAFIHPAPQTEPALAPQKAPPTETAFTPSPAFQQPETPGGGEDAFLRGFMAAAGLSERPGLYRDPEQFGAVLGGLVLTVAAEMQALLRARGEAKLAARSSEHTMIRAEANNPLKFTPTPEDAVRVMFGAPTRSYLDANKAVKAGFHDLKRHQVQTFAAMQDALQRLIDEIGPDRIEARLPAAQGAGALFKTRKAQLWEAYVAVWQMMSRGRSDGLIENFMANFGEFYDRVGNEDRPEI